MNRTNKRIIFIVLLLVAILSIVLIFVVVSGNGRNNNLQERLLLGEKYLDELDYQSAIAVYEEAIWIDPKNKEAYLGLANVYIAMEEYDKAMEVLKSFEGESEIIEEKMNSILLLIEQKKAATIAGEEDVETDIQDDDETVNEVVEETDALDDNEWKEAYKTFLSGLLNEAYLTGDFFYIDEDDIPEIIIDYPIGPALYKYYQGNVVEVIRSEADGLGAIFTFENSSVFAKYFGNEGAIVYDFYKMNEDGSADSIVSTYELIDFDYDYTISEWYIDEVLVSKNEYYSKLKEMNDTYGELKGSFEYSKSVSDLIDILESENIILEGQVENRELYSEQIDTTSDEENNVAAYDLYNMVLSNAKNGLYHDGSSNDLYIDSSIEYAYADIDNDSIDELIISNYASFTAGNATYIYDYDVSTNNVNMIYDGTLDINIYDNGLITSASEHNHSLGDLWPFSVYRCNSSGVYEYETSVSSWDVEYGDYNNGDSFPFEVDADGNGVVYELYDGYMDDSEFDSWYNNNLSDASEIKLEYIGL